MQAEVHMIELTLDQAQALAQSVSPPTVIDPTTRKTYALVPTDAGSSAQETQGPRETPAPPWQYLVVREHPWRKQLYIKGRNMTVRQLVGDVKANRHTEDEAASNWHLPVEAVREALAYFEANPEVIELDAAQERYLVKQMSGPAWAPNPFPGARTADRYAQQNSLVLVTKNPGDFLALHSQDRNHAGIFAIYQDNNVGKDMTDADVMAAIANVENAVQYGYHITGEFHNLNAWR
jgi:uncharacterized protein (DUF433 family)